MRSLILVLVYKTTTNSCKQHSPVKSARVQEGFQDFIRVRHHTSKDGIKGIKKSGSINASRGKPHGVDVELYPFKRPSLVNMGQSGKGSYVEFFVHKSRISPIPGYMGGFGNPGRIVTGGSPLIIRNLNPKFVNTWWPFK